MSWSMLLFRHTCLKETIMNSLVNIMIVTTRKCNLNCSHCYNKSGPFKKDVLGENDIEAIIKDICTLQQEYTIERVTVTGGEFLILPNSLWILSRIKSCLLYTSDAADE